MQSKSTQALWIGIFLAATIVWAFSATANDGIRVVVALFFLALNRHSKNPFFDSAIIRGKKLENLVVSNFLIAARFSINASYSIYKFPITFIDCELVER